METDPKMVGHGITIEVKDVDEEKPVSLMAKFYKRLTQNLSSTLMHFPRQHSGLSAHNEDKF